MSLDIQVADLIACLLVLHGMFFARVQNEMLWCQSYPGCLKLYSLELLHRVSGPLFQEEEASPRGSSLASWSWLGVNLMGGKSFAHQ